MIGRGLNLPVSLSGKNMARESAGGCVLGGGGLCYAEVGHGSRAARRAIVPNKLATSDPGKFKECKREIVKRCFA